MDAFDGEVYGMFDGQHSFSPKPPFDKERVNHIWECTGMECTPISCCKVGTRLAWMKTCCKDC